MPSTADRPDFFTARRPDGSHEDPPFTDAERAAAGLPPIGRIRPRSSGTSQASFVRDLKRADAEEQARHQPAKPAGESRTGSAKVVPIRKGAQRAVSRAGGEARSAARTTQRSTRQLVSGRAPGSLSGLVLGLVGYALVINYVRYGWDGVKGWFAAKFENRPYQPTAAASQSLTTAAQRQNAPIGFPVIPEARTIALAPGTPTVTAPANSPIPQGAALA